MKSDIDQLMQAQDLDALLVIGAGQHNPAMYYFTGGVHLTDAILVKKHREEPILFHYPMERDEAAKTGLRIRSLTDFNYVELNKQAQGNNLKASVLLYQKILEQLDLISGNVGVFGLTDAGKAYAVFSGLAESLPGLNLIGQGDDSVLLQAMATKDPQEVDRIRKMGVITTNVVARVAEYLTSQWVNNNVLIRKDGEPVTIGDIKQKINLWIGELGAENPEGTIFSIGRDSAIPHSTGNPENLLQLGQTIVFDIFPCENGGGYYYDFTRTWCLGFAPDETLAIYENVYAVYQQVFAELKWGQPCSYYQDLACELFEAQGHPTIKSDSKTQNGYVHGLGHGLGLHIHENPRFSLLTPESTRLESGIVMTLEPGLYYPDKGIGVRLEDTLWFNPSGQIEVLAPFPMDLILPVKS